MNFKDKFNDKSREFKPKDLIDLHHDFMCVYGWIPLEEFKQLPCQTFWNLAKKVAEEKRKREELRLATLKFYGIKNPK